MSPPPFTVGRVAGRSRVLVWRNPYFATAHVAMVANSATATADGTLELVPPGVVETMFGPNIASNSTASQITEIASDAHISVIWSQANRLSTERSCGITLISASFPSRRALHMVARTGIRAKC